MTETYPEFSETYMHEEFVALEADYEIRVLALHESGYPRARTLPYMLIDYPDEHLSYGNFEFVNTAFTDPSQQAYLERMRRVMNAFSPQVVHAHYLYLVWLLEALAQRHNVPYTIRTHSFDMLHHDRDRLHAAIDVLKSPNCKMVFAYPEFVDLLLSRGLAESKVRAAWPVVKVERFYDESSRKLSNKILCSGPCIKKKAHHQFIDLAKSMSGSGKTFSLYAKGHMANRMIEYNESLGSPAKIAFEEPENMAPVYRDHDWLVYTSDVEMNTVGLPAAVVEAQASGIGVCLQELPGRREAQLDFLGGGGHLFKKIDEVPDLLSEPYPEELRMKGFASSLRSDVRAHKSTLDDIWALGKP